MLESVAINADIIIVVVGIGKEFVSATKYVGSTDIGRREPNASRVVEVDDFLVIVGEGTADLVSQIGVGFPRAYNFDGRVYTDGAMISSDDERGSASGDLLKKGADGGIVKPALCNATVGGFVAYQLMHHLPVIGGMAHDVYEVEYKDIELVFLNLQKLADDLVNAKGVVDFVIRVSFLATESIHEGLEQLTFFEILSLILIFFDP